MIKMVLFEVKMSQRGILEVGGWLEKDVAVGCC